MSEFPRKKRKTLAKIYTQQLNETNTNTINNIDTQLSRINNEIRSLKKSNKNQNTKKLSMLYAKKDSFTVHKRDIKQNNKSVKRLSFNLKGNETTTFEKNTPTRELWPNKRDLFKKPTNKTKKGGLRRFKKTIKRKKKSKIKDKDKIKY